MFLLEGEQLRKLIPLLEDDPLDYPITKGVLDNVFDGWAVADQKDNPRNALIMHKHSGFMHYLGQLPEGESAEEFALAAINYRGDRAYNQCVEFAHCPEPVAKIIRSKYADTDSYFRISWNHNYRLFSNAPEPSVPTDCIIRLIQKKDFSHDLVTEETEIFWNNADDFLESSIGTIALTEGNQFLGVCSSVSDSDNFYEINIEVSKDYRNKGIGYAMAYRFIQECYIRGKKPHWDSLERNKPSGALAKKLGFLQAGKYPLISWKYTFTK